MLEPSRQEPRTLAVSCPEVPGHLPHVRPPTRFGAPDSVHKHELLHQPKRRGR
jgi:hypothetical protein